MEMKITIDQLKNYLGTGLKCKVRHRTIGGMEVKNPMFTLDSINVSFTRAQFWTYDPIFCDQFGFTGKGFQKNEFNPICYSLSDLDKFIPELGFVPLQEIWKLELGHKDWISKEREYLIEKRGLNYWFNHIPYGIIQKLFQWHFWTFGEEYFEQGLVIDKMLFSN